MALSGAMVRGYVVRCYARATCVTTRFESGWHHQLMHQHAGTSRNIETVNTYLDGFRNNDHEQILSCLTDDIEWTVFGAFHLTGKEAYDNAIDGAPDLHRPARVGGGAHGRGGRRRHGGAHRHG